MRHIISKQEFYKLSGKLLLGNKLRQWTWDQFQEAYLLRNAESDVRALATVDLDLPKIVGVRHVRKAFTNKGTSGLFPLQEAYVYGQMTPDKENLLFDEGAVHDRLTIQGEVMADEKGLCLRYSFLQCHQRTLWHIAHNGLVDLQPHQMPHNWQKFFIGRTHSERLEPELPVILYARGFKASAVLKQYMDADSWETLNEILACQCDQSNTWGNSEVNFTYPIVEFACFKGPIGVLGWNTLFWEVRTLY